jgi:hypothetical protein
MPKADEIDIVERLRLAAIRRWGTHANIAESVEGQAAAEILRLRSLSPGEGWKPIESAPKDGAWFEAYRPRAPGGFWQRIVILRWDDECEGFVWPDGIFDIYEQDLTERDAAGYFKHNVYEAGDTFTHWRPIPPVEDKV